MYNRYYFADNAETERQHVRGHTTPALQQAALFARAQQMAAANPAAIGMVEISGPAGAVMQQPGQPLVGPQAAMPVWGGFGAQPNLQPVRETLPQTIRGSVLGFDSGATGIAAGTAGTSVTSRPQAAFRPEKLEVASSIAPSFLISDIKIANSSMLLSTDNVPAELFIPNAQGVQLRWRTAQPAQDVTVEVENIGGGAARFLAGMTGTVAE